MIKKATGQNKRRRLKVIESSTNAQECDRVYGLDYLIVKQDHTDEGKQSAQITVFFLGRAPDAFEDKELAEQMETILHGQAKIMDGEQPNDPAKFAAALGKLLDKSFD